MDLSDIAASFSDVDYSDISSWPAVLKVIVSLLIGIGILVAMYFMFYQPVYEELQFSKIQETELREEFAKKQKQAANLPAYKQQLAEIKEQFSQVLKQLPEESEVPTLLTEISEAGVEQGLVFQRFKPSAPEQKNFYVRLPIQIQASGTYHQLAEFISAIANFQRVVTVGNLDLVRAMNLSGADEGVTPLTFNANIYTYHYSSSDSVQDGSTASRVSQ